MRRSFLVPALLAIAGTAQAQCGSGTADATVDGETGAYTTTQGSTEIYKGADYMAAIQAGLDAVSGGGRIVVLASGSIGTETISIASGVTFEGCGTIDVQNNKKGSVESVDTTGAQIPYLSLTGSPYFGLYFYGTTDLVLGDITMDLSGGLGIRFDRDRAASANVKMGTVTVSGAGSHAIETWNIDGLTIDAVVARNVGECGLLLQTTTNANVGSVDCTNCGAGTGYAALRFANQNGKTADGGYATNVYVKSVTAAGGGRGFFCVSESGGAEIGSLTVSDTESNAVLVENCYGVSILGGSVSGGGEVRVSARDEFANTRDVSITLQVDGTSVRESPCGENIKWDITGSASKDVCS